MARKGNQQKNAVDRQTSKHRKKGSDSGCTLGETKGNGKASEVKVFPGEELPNGDQPSSPLSASASKTNHPEDENKNRQKSGKSLRKEKQGMDAVQGPEESSSLGSDLGDHNGNNEAPSRREENGTLPPSHFRRKHTKRKSGSSLNRWHMRTLMARLEFSDTLLFRNLKASALPLLKMASEWLQRHEPLFLTIKSKALYARDYVKTKFEQAYPFVLKWLMQFGSILFLLSMAWLDCTLRGFDSLVRMGTTSFFSVIWCSLLSVVAMAGMFKFLIVLNGGHSVFPRGFPHPEADGEDPFGDSRRIACNKCGNLHVWVLTRKSKSQSRWCQDCKDFHQAKDGDGWVEQSSQPFFFGMLQKLDAPSAFICADSKIYNATEWYICQGMRCPANTHKPSFHVNTSVTSNKHNTGKGASSGQRGGQMPTSNMEENMTEEEFFEWLQNAVQTGMFENSGAGTSTESPSAKSGPGTRSGGSTSGSANKRKKKGKKW
ncbi:hypothetical protein C1H46_011609 [Malus baccata]|uniref:Cleavage inducing molecular chaperone Jiv domain-containing protein n=1 Tax=Malus baccata TaxID=106549 RepID=A0A540MWQ0_MALBA|nr:hypothetical protein C1H46_011609 [Malus baccata]